MRRVKICPACGADNPPTAADCIHCKADILSESVEVRQVPAPEKTPPEAEVDERNAGAPFLVLQSLVAPEVEFQVGEGQTVGRSSSADVVIRGVPDLDATSRRMALFHRRGAQWYVQHVGSTNFIAVDGEEYGADDEVALQEGSVVGLPLCQFIVRIPEAR